MNNRGGVEGEILCTNWLAVSLLYSFKLRIWHYRFLKFAVVYANKWLFKSSYLTFFRGVSVSEPKLPFIQKLVTVSQTAEKCTSGGPHRILPPSSFFIMRKYFCKIHTLHRFKLLHLIEISSFKNEL